MEPVVRRISPGDWPQFRSLRLTALHDSPLAFVEQYQDVVIRGDHHWQQRVTRHADSATESIFVAEHADHPPDQSLREFEMAYARAG